jgi:menaquinone-dependent protoporphyrinogen IX oxidase
MKGLVIYKSRYGSAETYAKWLGEETGFEVLPVKKAGGLDEYDPLIIGSCVRASKPSIAGWVIKNWPKIKGKKLVFFTTSGALNTDPELQRIFEAVFPEDIRAQMRYFPLNGRKTMSELSWLDKKVMEMAIRMTRKKDPLMAERMGQDFDRVNREEIRPIVEHVKKIGGGSG